MTRFRPCIDLHNGKVKQIVGATLSDDGAALRQNFVSTEPAAHFAEMFARDQLPGGHVIQLGPGNQDAAASALATYPGGLQIGGGITIENASGWLDRGASHVIVTSWLFDENGRFQLPRLQQLVKRVGQKRIVVDLSCKRSGNGWTVAMNRWQTLTDFQITSQNLDDLVDYCDEFLIHAADVEGLCEGADLQLVELLGKWAKRPLTYAGGIRDFSDIKSISEIGQGNVDVTVGSALDIFGGQGLQYKDLVAFNRRD